MDKKEPKMVITTDKKRRVSWPHKNGSTNETIPCYSNFETNLRNTKTGSKMACPSVPFYWDFHLLYYVFAWVYSKQTDVKGDCKKISGYRLDVKNGVWGQSRRGQTAFGQTTWRTLLWLATAEKRFLLYIFELATPWGYDIVTLLSY